MYKGDFAADLPGEQWLVNHRDELRRAYESALLELGRLRFQAGQPRSAADPLTRLVEHDPLVESAHRELMRCYAAMGDRGRALTQYRRLADVLRVELDAQDTRHPATGRRAPAGLIRCLLGQLYVAFSDSPSVSPSGGRRSS
jgi:DNA-binding SARP family transcriptional activator